MTNRTDNFNRANSATTPNPPSDGGSNWTVHVGTMGITSNTGYFLGASIVAALESAVADCDVQVTMSVVNSSYPAIVWRLSDSTNWWMWYGGGGVYKDVAGSLTLVATRATFDDGDVVKLTCNGTTFAGLKNGGSWGADITGQTHNQYATQHGVKSSGSNGSVDDFSIAELAGETAEGAAYVYTFGAIAALGVKAALVAALLAASGSASGGLDASISKGALGAAALGGAGGLAAAGTSTEVHGGTAAIAANGALAALGAKHALAIATVATGGSLAATGAKGARSVAALGGYGAIAAASQAVAATPASRTLMLPAEQRTRRVPGEHRTLTLH